MWTAATPLWMGSQWLATTLARNQARRLQAVAGESYARAVCRVTMPPGETGTGREADGVLRGAVLPMPGIENTDDRDLTTAWLLHSQSSDVDQPDRRPVLTVPLGLRSDGTPLWLDLSEEAEGGSGPRGVFIGITG